MAQQTQGVPSTEGSVPQLLWRAGAWAFGSAREEGGSNKRIISNVIKSGTVQRDMEGSRCADELGLQMKEGLSAEHRENKSIADVAMKQLHPASMSAPRH